MWLMLKELRLLIVVVLVLFVRIDAKNRTKYRNNDDSKTTVEAVNSNNRVYTKNRNVTISANIEKVQDNNCTIKTLKRNMIELVVTETVPANILILIWTKEISQNEKINLVNQTLKHRGLDTFPSCKISPFELPVNNDQQQGFASKTDSKQESNHSLPCARECVENENQSLKNLPKEQFCDPRNVILILLRYPNFNQLPFDRLLTLFAKKPSHQVNVNQLNQLLQEANVGIPLFTPSSCINKTGLQNVNISKCNAAMKNKSKLEKMQMVRQFEQTGLIPKGTLKNFLSGKLSLLRLKGLVIAALAKSGRIPQFCAHVTKSQKQAPSRALYSQGTKQFTLNAEQDKLRELIDAGYLPSDVEEKLASGEITKEWIIRNISQNKEYIMSQLPDPVRKLIESGKMPSDIEEAIFSGEYNKSEIIKMIADNDDALKAMLPQDLLYMLKDQPIPQEVKNLIISGKNASEIREIIENDDKLLQEMMTSSTYFFYQLFSDQRNKDINKAISIILIITLTVVMTSLGCTMTISEIGKHAKNPKGVVIALIAQFIIMPASAYGLTQLFGLEVFAAIAVLICGCCPGGNLSNILAYALNGDMNLSILMTTCSSILGLGFMPLNIFLYSQLIVPLESGQVVPFDKIVVNIALTIIPVLIGIAIRHFKPKWVDAVMKFGAVVLFCSMITVAVLSGIMFGDAFFVYFPLPVLGCCAILPLTGYTLGYGFAWIAREDPKCMRTISVETGCQNVQLCSTVLKLAFDPILVGVLFLMPIVYMGFQVLEALLMIFGFRLYNYLTKRGKKTVSELNESEKLDKNSSYDDRDNLNDDKVNEKGSQNLSEAKKLLSSDSQQANLIIDYEKIVDHETLV